MKKWTRAEWKKQKFEISLAASDSWCWPLRPFLGPTAARKRLRCKFVHIWFRFLYQEDKGRQGETEGRQHGSDLIFPQQMSSDLMSSCEKFFFDLRHRKSSSSISCLDVSVGGHLTLHCRNFWEHICKLSCTGLAVNMKTCNIYHYNMAHVKRFTYMADWNVKMQIWDSLLWKMKTAWNSQCSCSMDLSLCCIFQSFLKLFLLLLVFLLWLLPLLAVGGRTSSACFVVRTTGNMKDG